MFCSSCGTNVRDDAKFCPSCGNSLSADSSAALATVATAYAAPPSEREYAGFGARFVAWLIDNIVLIIPGLIVAVIVGVIFGAMFGNTDSTAGSQAANDSVDTAVGVGVYVGYFVAWLAYNWIITAIGGGIGMRAMGIEIVDERTGHAPDAGKALGRTLVSIFSGFLYLG